MNINNGNEEAVVISLKDMAVLFLKRLWIIVLVAIIAGVSCFAWLSSQYEERYTSTVEVVLFSEVGSKSLSATMSYFQIADQMVKDCKYVLTSDQVVGSVLKDLTTGDAETIESLGVSGENGISRRLRTILEQKSTAQVKGYISVSNVADSHVVFISVTTEDPELSQVLANAICNRGAEKMDEIYGSDPLFVLSEGRLPRAPSNSVSRVIPLAMAFFAGAIIYGIALLVKLSNNKINCAEDVEKYLGLSVLGEIPVVNQNAKKRRRYY